MSFGYANGLDHLVVIGSNVLVETIQVLVIYPLFVLSWRNLVDCDGCVATSCRCRRSAGSQRDPGRRYA